MIFIVPIIAIFIIVWAIDSVYYAPKPPIEKKEVEKNITKENEAFEKYFEKYIKK